MKRPIDPKPEPRPEPVRRSRRLFCAPWEDPLAAIERAEEAAPPRGPRVARRLVLQGIGGVALSLPFLDGFLGGPSRAAAQATQSSYAVFFRQANGVAAAQNTEIGSEPERFWPRTFGALTPDNWSGRSLEELEPHRSKLLVVRNVNMRNFNYGDGHARGALQVLTARGPSVEGQGGESEAAGESIDHRIGRELNPDARDSWFIYVGQNGGWLGGACISYRGSAQRRSAMNSPLEAYRGLVGSDGGLSTEAQRQLAERGRSVNDLVRAQLDRLIASRRMSRVDRDRLELHRSSIRDLEVRLSCQLDEERERALENAGSIYGSTDGTQVLAGARFHMDVAAVAIACGVTRSVAIQIGNGNDGSTRYRRLDNGQPMENFHFISHRRLSHGADGTILSNSDQMHAMVDRQFAQTFRHLLDRLSEYPLPSGGTLLDAGVSMWVNDLGNGPAHAARNVPVVLAGSAGGFLRQGQYIDANGGQSVENYAQLLNTIGTAAGLRRGSGPLDNFGDPAMPGGLLRDLVA